MAAPIVLASLASKPVLGAAPHNCTISGQVSGNVSTHIQGTCSVLGDNATTWALNVAIWPQPAYFFSNPLLPTALTSLPFASSPNSSTYPKFEDAFQVNYLTGVTTPASIWQVCNGAVKGGQIVAKAGFTVSPLLGKEAVAALLNSLRGVKGYPAYPVEASEVIKMFNAIAKEGSYVTGLSSPRWYEVDVIRYFQSLHP